MFPLNVFISPLWQSIRNGCARLHVGKVFVENLWWIKAKDETIDLSDRSFHGALLDSQLLAAVYLELRGGKQFSMELNSNIDDKNTQINNKNETKTKIIEVNKEDYLAHKEMLKKLKNPLWKKFNY